MRRVTVTSVFAMLAIAAFGIGVSVRLAREARLGPIETSRHLAYADRGAWSQFYEVGGMRHEEAQHEEEAGPVLQVPAPKPQEEP